MFEQQIMLLLSCERKREKAIGRILFGNYLQGCTASQTADTETTSIT
jgi:hypothetical protein